VSASRAPCARPHIADGRSEPPVSRFYETTNLQSYANGHLYPVSPTHSTRANVAFFPHQASGLPHARTGTHPAPMRKFNPDDCSSGPLSPLPGSNVTPPRRRFVDSTPLLSRRDGIRAAWGLIGAFLLRDLPCADPYTREPGTIRNWLQRVGAPILADPSAMVRFGAAYLAAHPLERDRTLLGELVSLPRHLAERVARDWSEHDVAIIEGWVLARTEGRLCALVYLSQSAGT